MKKQIFTLLLSACMALTAWGAKFTVINSNDNGPGSLREAVIDANALFGTDTILFSPSTNGIPIFLSTGEISVTEGLFIFGNDSTLTVVDANSTSRIFSAINLPAGRENFQLLGMTLREGMALNGGAVLSINTITDAVLCHFYKNNAIGLASNEGGGAIYNLGFGLGVQFCGFVNNNAIGLAGSGGAIWTNGDLLVADSYISDNTAKRAGGGIEIGVKPNGATTTTILNTLLNNNFAVVGGNPGNGGGLHITDTGTVNIFGGTANGNQAASEGGALWNNRGLMTLNGTNVYDNSAHGDQPDNGGGGVFNNGGTLFLNRSISLIPTDVSFNSADGISGSGGGVFSVDGTVTVNGSLITFNLANRAGGGIEILNGVLNLTEAWVMGNDVNGTAGPPNPGNGGGIHVSDGATVNILHSIITQNVAAKQGGGLWNHKNANMNVDTSVIEMNMAHGPVATDGGGGIWNDGGNLNVVSTTVSANRATTAALGVGGSGGGLYNDSGIVSIQLCTFSGNIAEVYGGGIFNSGEQDITASTIASNNAGSQGGGIDQPSSAVVVLAAQSEAIATSIMTTLRSTIVADNNAPLGSGIELGISTFPYVSAGYNLVEGDDANVFTPLPTDVEGQDPNLAPLNFNGGFNQTHALVCPSPAVDAGDPGLAMNDQRGQPLFGPQRDMGAFELQAACSSPPTPGPCGASIVSDANFLKSTAVTPSNNSGAWGGVGGAFPPNASYTLNAVEGQPYSFHSIDSVDGAKVIKTENNITFFKQDLTLVSPTNISARLRLNVDDQAEVYVNGVLLAANYTISRSARANPAFDVLFNANGTVTNPNGGGQQFDFATATGMGSIFTNGANTVVVAVRNFAKVSDRGGFSLRLDVNCGSGVQVVDSCVSDTSWRESTTVTTSNLSGGWSGVAALPAIATFTQPVMIGQPYGFPSIQKVPGTEVIKSGNNIRYFRKKFDLTDNTGLETRIRMTFDDAAEVWLNGTKLLRENTAGPINWKLPPHDILYPSGGGVVNGNAGGDSYDFVAGASANSLFTLTDNLLVVVLRNFNKNSDLGGFSFRIDVNKAGQSVLVKKDQSFINPSVDEWLIEIFPNPTTGKLTLLLPLLVDDETAEVQVYGTDGQLVKVLYRSAGDPPVEEIDLSQNAEGLYFLRYVFEGQAQTQKIVKR